MTAGKQCIEWLKPHLEGRNSALQQKCWMVDEFLANLGLVVLLVGSGRTVLARKEQNAPFTSSCFSYLLLSVWWLQHEPVPLSVRPPATSTLTGSPSPRRARGLRALPLIGFGCLPVRAASCPAQTAGCWISDSFLTRFPPVSSQYFPGRPCVQSYLQALDGWLRNWTEPELPRSALKEAVKNNQDVRLPPPLSPSSPSRSPAPSGRVPLSCRPSPRPCSPPTSPGWAAGAASPISAATPAGSGPSSTC